MKFINKKAQKLILPALLLLFSLSIFPSQLPTTQDADLAAQAKTITEEKERNRNESCQPGLSRGSIEYAFHDEIECLIAEKKNIFRKNQLGTDILYDERLAPLLKEGILKNLHFLSKFTRGEGELTLPIVIIYRNNQEAKRDALMLAIASLTDLYDGMSPYTRSYLEGLLFGYPKEDIEYWIERQVLFLKKNDPLFNTAMTKKKLADLNEISYSKWTADDKKEFENLLKTLGVKNIIDQAKQETKTWINKYKKVSNDKLSSMYENLKIDNKKKYIKKHKKLSFMPLIALLENNPNLLSESSKLLEKWVYLQPKEELDLYEMTINKILNVDGSFQVNFTPKKKLLLGKILEKIEWFKNTPGLD